MRIGFDVSQTGPAKAGCGFFAENLIQHIAQMDLVNQYLLYSTFGSHFWDNNFNVTCRINQSNFQNGFIKTSNYLTKTLWQASPEIIEKELGNVDIVHSNNFYCPTSFTTTKLVYSLYDLSFLEHPNCTTEHNRIACFEGVFNASLFADLIIVISDYTRQHFLNTFPHYPANRIIVAPLASRFDAKTPVTAKPRKLCALNPQKFWLNVGTIEPRKNINRLLKAYAELRKLDPNTYPLVLAGKKGWLAQDTDTLIHDLGLAPHIQLLGYVDNNELQWLYQNCLCLVYPSLFEGFGLPVLEAMSFGAPVITSNVTSLPQVAGDAGLLVNPASEVEILEAMRHLATNQSYREELTILAKKQASLFSWNKTAKIVLNAYEEVMSLPKYSSQIITA